MGAATPVSVVNLSIALLGVWFGGRQRPRSA
jgi:hypothetical protein